MHILKTTFFLLTISIQGYSQKQTTSHGPQKYIITSCKVDGVDNTAAELERKSYLVITEFGNSGRFFLLYDSKVYTDYSYGPISNILFSKDEKNGGKFESDTLRFKWHFHNSCDEKSGNSDNTLVRVMKPDQPTFKMIMILPSKETIEYSGYFVR